MTLHKAATWTKVTDMITWLNRLVEPGLKPSCLDSYPGIGVLFFNNPVFSLMCQKQFPALAGCALVRA